MSRKVSMFGLGYLGSVTAACLASKGNSVIGVDVSAFKAEELEAGRSPIVEPGMKELVESAHASSCLHATTDSAAGHHADRDLVSVRGDSQPARGKA